jgi:ABC-type branched-subunit amino acid transport system permease subunit
MELLFVTLIAFCIGLAARYALPGRDTYGVALIPAIAAIVAAVVWVALTWAGWKFDGGWIWVASLVAGGVVSLVLALLVPRTRRHRDEDLLQQLSRA